MSEWEQHHKTLHGLYMTENKTAKETKEHMESVSMFQATWVWKTARYLEAQLISGQTATVCTTIQEVEMEKEYEKEWLGVRITKIEWPRTKGYLSVS